MSLVPESDLLIFVNSLEPDTIKAYDLKKGAIVKTSVEKFQISSLDSGKDEILAVGKEGWSMYRIKGQIRNQITLS